MAATHTNTHTHKTNINQSKAMKSNRIDWKKIKSNKIKVLLMIFIEVYCYRFGTFERTFNKQMTL